MKRILSYLHRLLLRKNTAHSQIPEASNQTENEQPAATNEPIDSDYPTFPPASPKEILSDPEQYWQKITARKYGAPRGEFEDKPLYALYRLYECIVLDRVLTYRSMLEFFWREHRWPVCEIPDPEDEDPARYAFLAGVTYLMVRSFNARVAMGLTRDAPPIMGMEEIEKARNTKDSERPYECVPAWAELAPPLEETISIPTHDGEMLNGGDDERADHDFLAKNILIWTPHIYFT